MGNKHWQSFGERNRTEAFNDAAKDEFREELPFVADDKGLLDAVRPRRDFLKYLGFSTAAAAIAASCEIPVRHSIPFANKPEDIIPGASYFYATTYVNNGDAVSILARVRDGRPTKIEGNELSPITYGGTSARVQASVLDLYDTARLRYPYISRKQNEVTFDAIDRAVAADLAGLGGAPVVILTGTVNSPTTKAAIAQFLAKYPGSRHVQYDAVSHSGQLLANKASYGRQAIPTYRFDNANVIVGINADFLGTWLSPVEFGPQYAKGRKIDEKNPTMSKHIQFESVLSMTGGCADEHYLLRPSETGAVAVALLNAINGGAAGNTGISDAALNAGIQKTAKLLAANRGAGLVVCGSNDPNVQMVVNAINEAIGANGKTIDWSTTLNYRQGIDSDFAQLVEDMNAGRVGALLIHGVNPVYTWGDSKRVQDGLKKVRATVAFSYKNDETTQLCKYVIPDHHFLESWGDAEPRSGNYSLIQPTIFPLFKTRQWQDSLLKWSGAATDYPTYVKQYWTGVLGGPDAWNRALQDGVIHPSGSIKNINTSLTPNSASANVDSTKNAQGAVGTTKIITPAPTPAAAQLTAGGGGGTAAYNGGAVAGAITAIGSSVANKGGTELYIYQKVGIGAGEGASNPWLQELPDPVTRATWDNYVIISPAMAKSLLGIDLQKAGDTDDYEVHPAKQVLKVTAGNKSIELPFLIVPGTHPNTIGIAVGYGRTPELGKAVTIGGGKNVYPFVTFNGTTVSFNVPAVNIEKTGDTYPVAQVQTHSTYDTAQGKRTEVVKEMSLADFKAKPNEVMDEREEELQPFGGLERYEKQGTLYPHHEKPGVKWGMTVDMNSCIGCGACVIACISENNIPVVGKEEVARFHDMHWLRIDRYYSGNMDNPHVTYQPMLCQHCDNAPCENVCPVSATNHSSEGLNQMIYNRCIGTRYCANNCPYKVRRFNWADYTGADSFPDNQRQVLDAVVLNMNEPLTRMVLNPDVTSRSHGVMEKCSFCVQRLQEGKLRAKRESRTLKTGENGEWDLKTACQQACPTNVFVFGNVNDPNSAIYQSRRDNQQRGYGVIEMLHTLPNITYFTRIRNIDEHIGVDEHQEGEGTA